MIEQIQWDFVIFLCFQVQKCHPTQMFRAKKNSEKNSAYLCYDSNPLTKNKATHTKNTVDGGGFRNPAPHGMYKTS